MKLELIIDKNPKFDAKIIGNIRIVFDSQMREVRKNAVKNSSASKIFTHQDLSDIEGFEPREFRKKLKKNDPMAKNDPAKIETEEVQKRDISVLLDLPKKTADILYQLDYLGEPAEKSARKEIYDCGEDFYLEVIRNQNSAYLNVFFLKEAQKISILPNKLTLYQINNILKSNEFAQSATLIKNGIKSNVLGKIA